MNSRILIATAILACASLVSAAESPGLVFCCRPENDLYRVLQGGSSQPLRRVDNPSSAVSAAAKGAGVLILADGYPGKTMAIDANLFAEAAKKRLRLYLEYPATLPGFSVASPQSAGIRRGVVTSNIFGEALPLMRIVTINGCNFLPIKATNAWIVLAKVAGVDKAVFGLKDTPSDPILFKLPDREILVATTRLSSFASGRYQPKDAWRGIWGGILRWLQPQGSAPALEWTEAVRPSYSPNEPLPDKVELQALKRAGDWISRSRTLRHSSWPPEALKNALTYNTVRVMPGTNWARGDGSLGILEGFSSTINADGSQPMRYAVRNDCTLESAMLLAFDGRDDSVRMATNLVSYIFNSSGLAGGPRGDPKQASFGLVGWALDSPGAYWGDDNARALLGLGAVCALLEDSRWEEPIARCILANFRTSGRNGFREGCISEQALSAKGWQAYWNSNPVQYSPHFQSWLWACYLWAYDQTRYEPLLRRSKAGFRQMMAAYPQRWDWVIRSGTIERARMLLPLAWLVRVEDTPEHRRQLRRVAEDLIALQDASGAIREVIGSGGPGTLSNAEYGTRETSLIQSDGDPICDLLYSCNFALIGLHEAAAATGDSFYSEAENRLARFLCRIQIRSEAHPELDGAWYRAFDFRRWEFWASNADWEWGPWCIESGWSQPWIAGTLALRQQRTSLWDLLRQCKLERSFTRLRPGMLPDSVLTTGVPAAVHEGRGKAVELATDFAPQYAAGGNEGLTDGEVGSTNYQDSAWQGYHGVDLLATIDLGKTQPIRRISARFLQDVSVGIFLPSRIEFALSENGQDFVALPIKKHDVPETVPGPLIKTIELNLDSRPARFVRVRARNLGVIPEWHDARKLKAWLFVDEIMINPATEK